MYGLQRHSALSEYQLFHFMATSLWETYKLDIPHFPHQQNRNIMGSCLERWLWRLNESIPALLAFPNYQAKVKWQQQWVSVPQLSVHPYISQLPLPLDWGYVTGSGQAPWVAVVKDQCAFSAPQWWWLQRPHSPGEVVLTWKEPVPKP